MMSIKDAIAKSVSDFGSFDWVFVGMLFVLPAIAVVCFTIYAVTALLTGNPL